MVYLMFAKTCYGLNTIIQNNENNNFRKYKVRLYFVF